MFSTFLKMTSTDYTICTMPKLDLQNGEKEITAQNLPFSGDFTKQLMYWKCHVHDLFSHFGIRKENSAFTIR